MRDFIEENGYWIFLIVIFCIYAGAEAYKDHTEQACRERMIAAGKTVDDAMKVCKGDNLKLN